jgi:hypothetical protein
MHRDLHIKPWAPLLALGLAFGPGSARAGAAELACVVQPGGCDVLLTASPDGRISLDGRVLGGTLYAGKTLCIPPRGAGPYRYLWMREMWGEPGRPMTITNCGGQAVFDNSTGTTLAFETVSFAHLTGTGSAAHAYGIVAHNSGIGAMVDFNYGSSDIEIDHVEARGNPVAGSPETGDPVLTGGSGIAVRTYPRCSDGKWRRGTWAMNNVFVHDNYIHDTRYEGLYIGPSHHGWVAANAYTPGFDCSATVPAPVPPPACEGITGRWCEADVNNVVIVRNRLENIGNDAIQVGAAVGGAFVAHNHVRDYGLHDDDPHSAGVQFGPGSRGVVDANWLENRPSQRIFGQGLKHMGLGETSYTNNVVIGARNALQLLRNTDVNLGMDVPGVHLHNNTLLASKQEALYYLCANFDTIYLKNNLVAGYALPYPNGGAGAGCIPTLASGNRYVGDAADVGFVDLGALDLHLAPGSPAANSATSLEGLVDVDFDGADRMRRPYDYGAFATPATTPCPTSAKGDLNSDGRPDLIWRHGSSNRHMIWTLNGSTLVQSRWLAPDPAPGWQVVGADDFDGDGRSDVVLVDALGAGVEFWLLRDGVRQGAARALAAPLPPPWTLAATGDFNGDGWPDLLWRNASSQKLLVWTLVGTHKTGEIVPTPDQAVDANWEVVAALDYDGDRVRDLLWYNRNSGKIVIWFMNPAVQRTSGRFAEPPAAGDSNWKVLAGGKYSGNSARACTHDIVWRNATSGRTVVWRMDAQGVRLSGVFTAPDGPMATPDGLPTSRLDWVLAGPR